MYRGPECVEGYEEQAVLPTGAPTGRPTDGGNARGLLTPSSSVSASLATSPSISSPTASVKAEASNVVVSDDILNAIPLDALSLDDTTLKKAEANAEFAAALKRKYLRGLENAKLQCSLFFFLYSV